MNHYLSPRKSFPSPSLFAFAVAAFGVTHAAAQPGQAPPVGRTVSGERQVTLTQTVEPSFRIEPVVHRFSARRGEVIPFEFLIGSMGKEMEVTVTPVNLRQEESGIILHDSQSEPARALRITSPRKFSLAPGRQSLIKGTVTVPLVKSNYLSYGILVREAGEQPDFDEAGDAPTRAGIRFVTQYVLRVDIETGLADVGSMSELRFEAGTVVAAHGLPRLVGKLRNPTDYAFECFVSAQVGNELTRKSPTSRLGMLSRQTLDGEERHLVRVMPHSVLRLEAPVEHPMSPGEQSLRLSLSSGRREISAAEFALDVRGSDFPALAQQRAVLAGVSVSPPQIEIGSIRSTTRTVGIKFQNNAADPAEIRITPLTLSGEPLLQVRFSPSSFKLKPGRTKGVRAILRKAKADAIESGVAVVRWSRDGADDIEERLPLSILNADPGAPSLEVSDLAWRQLDGGGAFAVDVTNNSEAYSPIAAQLSVGGPGRMRMHLEDGYGRWLAPGETTTLAFRPGGPVPAGSYGLQLEIRHREGFPPLVRELNVVLNGDAFTASTDAGEPAATRG